VVTGDVRPRVIRLAFVGGQNLFKEYADQMGGQNAEKFRLRGGHRVWKSPEDPVATWAPGNVAVRVAVTPNGLIANAPGEPLTCLQKEIEVRLASQGTEVEVIIGLEFDRAMWTLIANVLVTVFLTLFTKPKSEKDLQDLVYGLTHMPSTGSLPVVKRPIRVGCYPWAGFCRVEHHFLVSDR
jgi:hypothetical protein